jgi:hypothetical protein
LLNRLRQASPAMLAGDLAIAARPGDGRFDIDLSLYALRAAAGQS